MARCPLSSGEIDWPRAATERAGGMQTVTAKYRLGWYQFVAG